MADVEKELLMAEPQPLAKKTAEQIRDPALPSDSFLWYLAYGSNMNPKVLTDRRKVKPLESKACECKELFLSFDLRSSFAYVEPCFASVLEAPKKHNWSLEEINYFRARTGNPPIKVIGQEDPEKLKEYIPPTLHGVIHKISVQEMDMIRKTEGGGGYDEFGYREKHVEVITYDGTKLNAVTLIANSHLSMPGHQASPRYLNILREGARLHGVADFYCQYLDSLEPYRPPSIREKIGRYVFLVSMVPVMALFVTIFVGPRLFGYKGKLPWSVYWVLEKVNVGVGWYHDYFFSKIFGNGHCCWKEKIVTL